jgi:hypothetical protein
MALSPAQHGNIVTMQENNEILLIFFLLALIEFIGAKKNLLREGWLDIS